MAGLVHRPARVVTFAVAIAVQGRLEVAVTPIVRAGGR